MFQPDPTIRAIGLQPYALGFAMMQDIERIVTNPEDEIANGPYIGAPAM